jgi:hypothetical protein
MGQLKRQLVMWGAIATTTAVLPGLALADMASPDHGGGRHGRGDRHGHDDAKLSVAGRAYSKGTTDSYGIQIRGRSGEQPTDARGLVRFGHKGADSFDGLVGEITCLKKDEAGIVTATGTIKRSGKRDKKDMKKGPGTESAAMSDDALLDEIVPWDADENAELADHRDGKRGGKGERGRRGGELAGKDFAFTIDVPAKPQKFSTPTIGEKGTLAACSGGGTPVEVTRGKFRAHEAGDKADSDGKHDRGDRKGRRGWWR